jgi:hypothetical protein
MGPFDRTTESEPPAPALVLEDDALGVQEHTEDAAPVLDSQGRGFDVPRFCPFTSADDERQDRDCDDPDRADPPHPPILPLQPLEALFNAHRLISMARSHWRQRPSLFTLKGGKNFRRLRAPLASSDIAGS